MEYVLTSLSGLGYDISDSMADVYTRKHVDMQNMQVMLLAFTESDEIMCSIAIQFTFLNLKELGLFFLRTREFRMGRHT